MTLLAGGVPGLSTTPTWKYLSPLPSGSGERGTLAYLWCSGNSTLILVEVVFSFLGITGWGWIGSCFILTNFLPFNFGSCLSAGTGLVLNSSSGSPYGLSFNVVNTLTNPFATTHYSSVTISGDPSFNSTSYVCCYPIPLPRTDLTLTIRSSVTTLAYNSESQTWSDGTHTLACGGGFGFITLTGGGLWTFQFSGSTGDPVHLVFSNGIDTAYVDE